MSATGREELDWREQLARIDRAQAETRKFVAKQNKLAEEASNLRVSRYVTPIALAVTAVAGLIAATPAILRWMGGG